MENPNNQNAAAASLVLGIISLVISFFGAAFYPAIIGLILGIVGIALSSSAKKQGFSGGLNTGGLVLSILGVVFNGISFIACALCAGAIGLLA